MSTQPGPLSHTATGTAVLVAEMVSEFLNNPNTNPVAMGITWSWLKGVLALIHSCFGHHSEKTPADNNPIINMCNPGEGSSDYQQMKKGQLQEILKRRNITYSGYNKADLVGLAEAALHLYEEIEDDQNSVALKRRELIHEGEEELLPDPDKLKSWTRDLKKLPLLQSGHVIAYAGKYFFFLIYSNMYVYWRFR